MRATPPSCASRPAPDKQTLPVPTGRPRHARERRPDPLPDRDRNRVARAYAVTAFHPAPRKILMIGIGSGSWLQVLANSCDVESVTVVEINPGYLEAMRASPVVASGLDHPKSEIIIDDGRRWLASTDRRFDVIIQNTIVFWRAHASNLLSREYLELTRSRLEPGGIVYLNTTSSTAAQHTAASQFTHAWRYQDMASLSDSPIGIDLDRWREALRGWTIDGVPVVDFGRHATAVDELLSQTHWRGHPTWEDRESILRRTAGEAVITDDNMASEWWAQATFP